MALYPVNLKVTDRLCVVVGGGNVACRKVRNLLGCGAVVRVVSPRVDPELEKVIRQNSIEWLRREYAEGDVQGAFLVFAATDNPGVQEQVAVEATKNRIMLNCADDPAGSDFHVPAHFRRGDLLVTISTNGGSPALSKQVRLKLEKDIGPEYESVVGLLSLVREAIVSRDQDSVTHGEIFRNLLKKNIVELVHASNWFDVQMLLLDELPADVDSADLVRRFLDTYDS